MTNWNRMLPTSVWRGWAPASGALVLSGAALLAAMVVLFGWVDWPALGRWAHPLAVPLALFAVAVGGLAVAVARRRGERAPRARTSAMSWWVVVGAAMLVAGVGWAATSWLLGEANQASDIDKRAAARVEAIKTGLGIGAGTTGIFALLLAVRRQQHNESDATEKNVTELYTKAADQLGSEQAPIRQAGLYALERLAHNNPGQRQSIVNVICAYLRMPYTPPDAQPPPAADEAQFKEHQRRVQEREVRLAAQRILAEHLQPEVRRTYWPDIDLDLTNAHLIDFTLTNGRVRKAVFAGATFAGHAEFSNATFTARAWFDGATFTGGAWFYGASFNGDAASLGDAGFLGGVGFPGGIGFPGGAGFLGATFIGDVRFDGATFTGGAWLDDVTFTGYAWFLGATFTGDARFDRATFTGHARFNGATITGHAAFPGATFTGDATFDHASFDGDATFHGATFTGDATFDRASFTRGATFHGATFTGDARFGHATFTGRAWFDRATFTGDAWFDRATVIGDARFDRATFTGDATFDDARFIGISGLDSVTVVGGARFARVTFVYDRPGYRPDLRALFRTTTTVARTTCRGAIVDPQNFRTVTSRFRRGDSRY